MNITFITGAGASAEALPCVDQIHTELEKMIKMFDQSTYDISRVKHTDTSFYSPSSIKNTVLSNLEWLKTETQRHSSIDTFAKKISLKYGIVEMNKFKYTFSLFLSILEGMKRDQRYDTFFASILKSDARKLPKNIKIISWNYDKQFEIAYNEYTNIK